MTYEPLHSAQAWSVRVKEKKLLDLLVTIVALQEVSLIPSQVPTFWAIGQHTAR